MNVSHAHAISYLLGMALVGAAVGIVLAVLLCVAVVVWISTR